jgi:hypothetical protein
MKFTIQRIGVIVLGGCIACSGGGSSPGLDAGISRATVVVEGECQAPGATFDDAGLSDVDFLRQIGCTADFQALASVPVDQTLPGARSGKVVYDTADHGALYFQNSVKYQVHYQFASTHLSGNGLPLVPSLAEFNTSEYYSKDRRFVLGAVSYYEEPKVWALEISPYDTASAAMVAELFYAVRDHAFFGPALTFHPASDAVKAMAAKLPGDIPIITTDELYAKTDYQPLNIARSIGRLTFATAADLDNGLYLPFQTFVVLDEAPNDISVMQGIITQEFQTPLSHLNVLSRNRKTPNMGLRNALTNPTLLAYKDKLVEISVGASEWTIREATLEEAQAFWDAHKPEKPILPPMDLTIRDLPDIKDVAPESPERTLRDSIKLGCNAFGGKAAQYAVLARTPGVPVKKAFGIPVYYYYVFMRDNGFFDRVKELQKDPQFMADFDTRYNALLAMRTDMLNAPLDPALESQLKARIDEYFPGKSVRFRTSTNSEDLEGFPCAGCYESHTGDADDWEDIRNAIRKAYASAWLFRTWEERSYYGVEHETVSMALLVHTNFPDEEANGVAVTANIFDATGVDPAFYVNVQYGGDAEVVHPPKGVQSDQILYFFTQPNQPTSYLAHSSLIPIGMTVLSRAQLYDLGTALNAIHKRFSNAYGPGVGNMGWYAMDVEFKFDNDEAPLEPPALIIKQARPYPKQSE